MEINEAGSLAVIVYSTFPDDDSAKSAARALVRQGLAACVNVLPGMTSFYIWEGKSEESGEVLLLAKTVSERAPQVMEEIASHHPYDEPALLVLPTIGGSRHYLEWIVAATQKMPDRPH